MDADSKKIIIDFINAKLTPKDFEFFLYSTIDPRDTKTRR